jgi:hypothetical protein
MREIIVTYKDIHCFKYSSQKRSEVFQFWKNIIKQMPENLKIEVKNKPTTLEERLKQGQRVYQFFTDNASKMLREYLNQYLVKLQNE